MTGEPTRLADKVAIVTGAGATGSGDFVGIGQAISILFARNGARVLLVDRNQENAEATLATIKEEGGEASVFLGDVTSNEDCQGMVQAALSRYGKVNVLINNVGISGPRTNHAHLRPDEHDLSWCRSCFILYCLIL